MNKSAYFLPEEWEVPRTRHKFQPILLDILNKSRRCEVRDESVVRLKFNYALRHLRPHSIHVASEFMLPE